MAKRRLREILTGPYAPESPASRAFAAIHKVEVWDDPAMSHEENERTFRATNVSQASRDPNFGYRTGEDEKKYDQLTEDLEHTHPHGLFVRGGDATNTLEDYSNKHRHNYDIHTASRTENSYMYRDKKHRDAAHAHVVKHHGAAAASKFNGSDLAEDVGIDAPGVKALALALSLQEGDVVSFPTAHVNPSDHNRGTRGWHLNQAQHWGDLSLQHDRLSKEHASHAVNHQYAVDSKHGMQDWEKSGGKHHEELSKLHTKIAGHYHAIANHHIDAGRALGVGNVKEEVEQIEEISGALARRYIDRKADKNWFSGWVSGNDPNWTSTANRKDVVRRLKNSRQGISRALKRATKEEVEKK